MRTGRVVWSTTLVLLLAGCTSPPQPLALAVLESAPAAAAVAAAHVESYEVQVDGETATGLIAIPTVTPTTLVVLVHPWGGTAELHRAGLQALADAGVLAVAMEFRGDQGAFKVEAGVQDTVAATLDLQARHPTVDRTLLYGWSMGGEIVLLAVARAPAGTYDYVFEGAGVTDLTSLWVVFVAARPAIEHETGGTPFQVPDAYMQRSPIEHVDDLEDKGVARYFIIHGVGDTPVPVEQAERLYSRMADAGLPVSYYLVTMDKDAWVCTPAVILCAPTPPVGVANHEAGGLRLMQPFLDHRIDRLPDPPADPVRGTYDGNAGTYEPSDVGT